MVGDVDSSRSVVEVEFDSPDSPDITRLARSGRGAEEEEGIEEDEEGCDERLWCFRKPGDHSSSFSISSLIASFEHSLLFTSVLFLSLAVPVVVRVWILALGLLPVGLFTIPSES